ncbi:MAG: peptidoglycan D,D-transpeptidase FtsI family protein [Bacilli bacterium]
MNDKKLLHRFRRFGLLQMWAAFGLAVLILRMGYMQVAAHDRYVALSARNRVDTFATPAPRGAIYDRNMRLLAYDRPSFSLIYARSRRSAAPVAALLAPVLSRSAAALSAQMGTNGAGAVHTLIVSHIPAAAVSYVREHQSELPGVSAIPDSVRVYPHGDAACHILGYINSIPFGRRREYIDQAGFPPSAKIGWSGVELSYDALLRGRPGRICAEVDSRGAPMRILPESRRATPGEDLTLTIDLDYQTYVQQLLARQVRRLRARGHHGVLHAMAVALEPHTGAVLALASYPTYKPSWFVDGMSDRTYTRLFAPAERNWATQAAVAPGSTVKPLTALYALAQHSISPATSFVCEGALKLPATDGKAIRCWTRHGSVSLTAALAQSCDVFFYRTSLRYGRWPPPGHESVAHWLTVSRLQSLRRLEQFQRAVGLGADSGVDLPDAETGYMNEGSAQVTDLPYTAIGQNEVFTPLELAVYVSTIANQGIKPTPYLVQRVRGRVLRTDAARFGRGLARLGVTESDLKIVQRGMELACNDPRGTAYYTFHGNNPSVYQAAGKTGTAETGIAGLDNAVFVGYAPFDHPQIAIAVVIPGGGHGADSTGPVARGMFDRFFAISSRRISSTR